jgi:hypothetical protein
MRGFCWVGNGFGNRCDVRGLVLQCKECGGTVSVGFHWEDELRKRK